MNSIEQLVEYLHCPRRYKFLLDNPVLNTRKTLSSNTNFIANCIKKMYTYRTKFEKDIPWSYIPKWMDEKPVDTNNQYKDSKNLLYKLNKFYYRYYLKELSGPGLVNFPVRLEYSISSGNLLYINDKIDLLHIKEIRLPGSPHLETTRKEVTLLDICEEDNNISFLKSDFLYRDISTYLRLWAFWESSDKTTWPNKYGKIVIGAGGIRVMTIKKLEDKERILEETERMARYILMGIKNKIFHPIFSSQCNDCIFKIRCSF